MSKPFALIVEDHVDSAIIFSEALKEAGFETETVRTGDAAVVRLSTAKPDVIVLDLGLPRVSGIEILERIRSDPRLAETRVVVATAHPQLTDGVRCQADIVLIKPISFSQLRDVAGRLSTNASSDQ
jgi:CheY-like chemotaxis protein